jgi:hypothetical protein
MLHSSFHSPPFAFFFPLHSTERANSGPILFNIDNH